MSSTVHSLASSSKMNSTANLVPFMIGLPERMFLSTVILFFRYLQTRNILKAMSLSTRRLDKTIPHLTQKIRKLPRATRLTATNTLESSGSSVFKDSARPSFPHLMLESNPGSQAENAFSEAMLSDPLLYP